MIQKIRIVYFFLFSLIIFNSLACSNSARLEYFFQKNKKGLVIIGVSVVALLFLRFFFYKNLGKKNQTKDFQQNKKVDAKNVDNNEEKKFENNRKLKANKKNKSLNGPTTIKAKIVSLSDVLEEKELKKYKETDKIQHQSTAQTMKFILVFTADRDVQKILPVYHRMVNGIFETNSENNQLEYIWFEDVVRGLFTTKKQDSFGKWFYYMNDQGKYWKKLSVFYENRGYQGDLLEGMIEIVPRNQNISIQYLYPDKEFLDWINEQNKIKN